MNRSRILKNLKNRGYIEIFYKKSEDISYTIRLTIKDNTFLFHYYYVDGNDVFDEHNYKDEQFTSFKEFDEFMQAVEAKFPDVEI